MHWLTIAFWLLLLAVALYALRRGGPTERWAAGMLLAAAVATLFVQAAAAHRYSSVQTGVAVVDCLLLIGLAVLAVRTDRGWTIGLAALQAITVLGHLGKFLDPALWRLGYAILTTGPAYPGLALLAFGTFRTSRRTGPRRSAS